MARVIAITSGKGGVGKTTFSVNVGYMLSKLNKRVLLIDGDFGLNNLDVVMGIENKIVWDLIDVVQNKCRVNQALISDFNNENLWVLPSNHTYDCFKIENIHIKKIIEDVYDLFDFIIIDCPAGIDFSLHKIISNVDSSIVVTTPHISAIRDADKIISLLKSYCIENISVVVNRARGDLILNGEMIKIESIASFLDENLLGVIPESDDVSMQLLVGGAIKHTSEVENSFYMIAKNILGEEYKVYDCTKRYKGFMGNIRKGLKRIV